MCIRLEKYKCIWDQLNIPNTIKTKNKLTKSADNKFDTGTEIRELRNNHFFFKHLKVYETDNITSRIK